jgi:hypothetical protein
MGVFVINPSPFFWGYNIFKNMGKTNLSNDKIDMVMKKFMSAMDMKIIIDDTNYSDYKYFNHLRYGTIRSLSYVIKVFDKKNELVYLVDVYWGVIGGQLRIYDMDFSSKSNIFDYLGFDDKLVINYLAEKTRGMAEEWIKTFPDRK